ncbi:MAG: alpha/beta hydrolase [Pseudomonadota bacterium]
MQTWNLDGRVSTSAGEVAWGSAGSGPDLVLAHGWPWSSFSWHRVIPDLAKHFHVHWYDMPGYGRSDQAGPRTGLDVQGQIFADMLSHWGFDQPMVVAHDFGGATTLRAALLHGARYRRYALMNVVAMRPWGSEFFDHVGRHVAAFQGLPPHIHGAVVRAYIEGALAHPIDPNDFDQLVSPWLIDQGKDSFYRQFAQADDRFTAEVEPRFGDISCPTAILWGADDPWIPIERGRALHALMPGSEFIELSGIGHLPQLEAPDRVLQALLPFLLSEETDKA